MVKVLDSKLLYNLSSMQSSMHHLEFLALLYTSVLQGNLHIYMQGSHYLRRTSIIPCLAGGLTIGYHGK